MSEVETAKQEVLLDLAVPRIIVLNEGTRQYILRCRRIIEADWLAYFRGIFVSSEQHGRERINIVDATSPRVALAEAVLESAEGYKVAGGAELSSLPNWRSKVPLAHRLLLGETLADVRPSTSLDADLVLEPEAESIYLSTTWTGEPDCMGHWEMQRFAGLKHVLKTPTQEQQTRYAREGSRSRVIGGSRSGRTIYPGANALLVRLYDELVLSVDGYSVAGSPLAGREAIIREMDTSHKVMAAQELFSPQMTAQLAGGDAE
jgi:hypothetical protein